MTSASEWYYELSDPSPSRGQTSRLGASTYVYKIFSYWTCLRYNNLVIRPESPYVPSVRPGPGEVAPLL